MPIPRHILLKTTFCRDNFDEGRFGMVDRISHFRVLEKIGEGGMGVVYRAHDDRIDRDVAIKVLPEEVSRDPDRLRRFEREARATGALNHPNILAIYDVGRHEGQPYIISELLDGRTLGDVVPVGGLPVSKAVDLALQVVNGLSAAHDHGVVHRDLKPANLFVTRDGFVKILDFGLAKLTGRGSSGGDGALPMTDASTAVGTVVGTVGYMSPEQVRGRPTDARSDIFSFGCVLYEMLSGRRAFAGETPADVVSAVLTSEPEDACIVKPDVPPELARVVSRCLEKQPENRFQSARDLLFALQDVSEVGRASSAGRSVRRRRAIPRRGIFLGGGLVLAAMAVAYLWNPSPLLGFEERDWVLVADFRHPEGEDELARALKLALTVGVQESGYVNVVSRPQIAGVLQQMQRPPDVAIDEVVGREICQRARVKGLLAPDVAKVGDGYLLTVGLIEPGSGAIVESFSARAEGEDGLLDALETVMKRLRRAIGESLIAVRARDKPLAAVTTASLDALKAYSAGLRLWNEGLHDQAVARYEEAVELDPDFASAYAALGSAYASYIFNSRDKARENFEAALDRLDRVGEHEINFIQAQYAGFRGRTEEEIHFLQVHLASYPDDVACHYNLGNTYRTLGDNERAIEAYREVLRIVPRNAGAMINLATCMVSAGDPEAAIEFYRAAFEIQPGWQSSGNLNHEYGMSLVQLGRFEEAGGVFELRLRQPSAGNRANAHRSLGQLALSQGLFKAAAAHFRDAVALHLAAGEPISAGRDRLFGALGEAARGRTVEAGVALDQAALEVPVQSGWTWLRSLVGSGFLAAGDVGDALRISDELKAWAESAEMPGEDMLNRRQLLEAGVLTAGGNPDRAIEILESLQRVGNSENGFLAATLAEAYQAAGRWSDAEQSLLALIRLRWDFYEGLVPWITAHYRLADVYERLGRPRDAVRYYRRFLQLWGDSDSELPEIETTRRRLKALEEM